MNQLNIKILPNCPNKEYVTDFYTKKVGTINYSRDCGVDLIFPKTVTFYKNIVTKCGLGIACELIPYNESESGPFDLVPRSSIVNTPLMLANSIGIFDPGYRGEVIAAFRCFPPYSGPKLSNNTCCYTAEQGTRLVQIVAPDRKPIQVNIVSELSSTDRGSNGFGSTGTN